MVQPSQRIDVAITESHSAVSRDQPQASWQGSRGTLMTSSRNWQSSAYCSWRSDTAPSADLDSSRVVRRRSSLQCACCKKRKAKPRIGGIHTYSYDTERPYICFWAILRACDDLWCHPIRATNHCLPLCMCKTRESCTETKVNYVTFIRDLSRE